MQQDRTTIAVDRGQLCELRDLATSMSRREGRTVTLREVIARILAAYKRIGETNGS